MKLVRLGIGIVMLSLLMVMVTGCQPSFSPGTFTDDMGREVVIDEIPQRLVSHVPGITEILFALGLEERVVGVSDFCNYPEAARLKNQVGGFFNPSMEKIIELDPDLVLTNGSVEYVMTQLDSLGITYIILGPKDIDGILKNIELLGKVTGTEGRAKEVIKDMQDRMSQVVTKVEGAPRVKAFYTFATTDLNNPWTGGPGSLVDSLINMAGGKNIAAKTVAPWVQISTEEVVSSDPEVLIVDAKMGSAVTQIAELKRHAIWSGITAVEQGRVYPIDGDLVNRSGPRIIQGLEKIARFLHPELFR